MIKLVVFLTKMIILVIKFACAMGRILSKVELIGIGAGMVGVGQKIINANDHLTRIHIHHSVKCSLLIFCPPLK